jgi:zinc ribbon protein
VRRSSAAKTPDTQPSGHGPLRASQRQAAPGGGDQGPVLTALGPHLATASCPQGHEVRDGARFCPACGASMAIGAVVARSAPSTTDGQATVAAAPPPFVPTQFTRPNVQEPPQAWQSQAPTGYGNQGPVWTSPETNPAPPTPVFGASPVGRTYSVANRAIPKKWVIGIAAAIGLAAVLILFFVLSHSGPKGLNDPDKLGADIGATLTYDQTDGSSADVTCLHLSGTQFTCHVSWSDSTPDMTVTATVSADGTTWITR